MHEETQGKLDPKGDNVKIVMTRGDHNPDQDIYLHRDGRFTRDYSEGNTIRAHQMKSGMHNGAFISVSTSSEVARYFATSGGTKDGYIYVIDSSLFNKYGVVARQDPDPMHPNEQEVSIRSAEGKELPREIIVEIQAVSRNQA
jgi:hypothetical protein